MALHPFLPNPSPFFTPPSPLGRHPSARPLYSLLSSTLLPASSPLHHPPPALFLFFPCRWARHSWQVTGNPILVAMSQNSERRGQGGIRVTRRNLCPSLFPDKRQIVRVGGSLWHPPTSLSALRAPFPGSPHVRRSKTPPGSLRPSPAHMQVSLSPPESPSSSQPRPSVSPTQSSTPIPPTHCITDGRLPST